MFRTAALFAAVSASIYLVLSLGYFVHNPQLRDMGNLTVLVTGGNTGVGKETARKLVSLGAEVIIACRSEDKYVALTCSSELSSQPV